MKATKGRRCNQIQNVTNLMPVEAGNCFTIDFAWKMSLTAVAMYRHQTMQLLKVCGGLIKDGGLFST
jgi:hypothetical protein